MLKFVRKIWKLKPRIPFSLHAKTPFKTFFTVAQNCHIASNVKPLYILNLCQWTVPCSKSLRARNTVHKVNMHKVSYYLRALCTLTRCDYPGLLLYFTIGVAIFDDLFKKRIFRYDKYSKPPITKAMFVNYR